ncbi:MAG: hypothetical protein MHM6MM_005127 [Cercozoa sp. M6MM]
MQLEAQREKEIRLARKRAARRRAAMRKGTPEPIEGRNHATFQTEDVWEEISVVPDVSVIATQTDAFKDRPPVRLPRFIPFPEGISVATQIEPGDLFNYDREVAPLLTTLTGKVIEQAWHEVCEFEELRFLDRRQRRYEKRRALQLAAAQRVRDKVERRAYERRMRLEAEEERKERENELRQLRVARTMAMRVVFDALDETRHKLALQRDRDEVAAIFDKDRADTSAFEAASTNAYETQAQEFLSRVARERPPTQEAVLLCVDSILQDAANVST